MCPVCRTYSFHMDVLLSLLTYVLYVASTLPASSSAFLCSSTATLTSYRASTLFFPQVTESICPKTHGTQTLSQLRPQWARRPKVPTPLGTTLDPGVMVRFGRAHPQGSCLVLYHHHWVEVPARTLPSTSCHICNLRLKAHPLLSHLGHRAPIQPPPHHF